MTHELLDDYMSDMLGLPAASESKPAPALSVVASPPAEPAAAPAAAAETSPAAAQLPPDFDPVADILAEFDAEVARAQGGAPSAAAAPAPAPADDFDPVADILAEFDAEVARAAAPTAPPPPAPAPAAGNFDLVADMLAEFDAEVAKSQPAAAPAPPAALAPAAPPAAPAPPPQQPAAAPTPAIPGLERAPERRRRAEDVIKRWLRFTLADQSYAVEVLKVQEVLRVPEVLALRGADPSVLGVMNLRGQIVPVVDLGTRLRAPPVEVTPLSRVIVLEVDGEAMGALVSTVAEVMAISEALIEHPSSLQCGSSCDCLTGVCRQGGHLTILLDAAKLLE